MDYYIISQDTRIDNYAEPLNASNLIGKYSTEGMNDNFKTTPVVVHIRDKAENEYIDFIERPRSLVSDKLKQLLEGYQKDIFFKPVVFTDVKRMKQSLYWFFAPPKVDCLSKDSEFNKNGTLKRIVICESKAIGKNVFLTEGTIEECIILSQDVVEIILRKCDYVGIIFKRVEKD